MRITRVYTRTGDGGTTRLVGGQEVGKDDLRIEGYGTVDELNAILGIARTFAKRSAADAAVRALVDDQLDEIQNDLFNVGSDLATRPADRWEGMFRVGPDDATKLERWIDAMNEELPPLKEFILPGGGEVGAFLHQARTVCRRAERRVVTLIREEPEAGTEVLKYLNRLSDYLFVLGRWAAKKLGEEEHSWRNPHQRAKR
jgi:cob(I)alamin adenosyltransferase